MTYEKLIFVTGATGYVGSCLIPCLLEKGYRVRILVRNPRRLSGQLWLSQVEVVEGDTLSPDGLDQYMQGVATAYYLVHNMTSGRDYFQREIESARNFASVADMNGVEHIIYLGGLADPDEDISLHMRSRIQTGDILRQGSTPVTEFRASLIIGSGSISFELIRCLTEQIPFLFVPIWMHNRTQPIAIQNVLDYLLAALDCQICRGKTYEIGGKDVITYAETVSVYARLRGLKRHIIVLPRMPVKLMAFFASKLSPVPASIAGPLLGGMRSDSLVRNSAARLDFPQIHLLDYPASVLDALKRISPIHLESIWENGASSFKINREGYFVEGRQVKIRVQAEVAYRVLTGLGGKKGWLYLNWLWKLRGFLDKLVGGPGLRGRREAGALVEGDILDFYRVELLEPGSRMRLKAELRAPGLGWMEWRIQIRDESEVMLTQIATFIPRGLPGFLYWYILLPVHRLVFMGLIRAIVDQAIEN